MLPLDAAHKTPCVVQSKTEQFIFYWDSTKKNDVVKRKIHKPQKARLQAVVFFFKDRVAWYKKMNKNKRMAQF